ncbi:hypothetical protein [Streptomyces sp. VRA16 Mangrove soil]|uniref:hypothetical protein n=1 Tax=Streptomyces sp. VRA16 Mangrove soil TaxID=2817434 RepID=UPI001A9CFB1E|nr:hypothetical protein [Streptomyces sp. VRA16 Mangrove soil]MBO1338034.1 hypothetical protein [Streptomyces sp. VRA16 Mangrove soil]
MVVQQHGGPVRRAAATAAALAGVVAGAAGCGGGAEAGDRGGDPAKAVHDAPDRLIREGSSQARTSMQMASGGTRVTIRGEGVYDYRDGLGQLRVRLPQDAAGTQEHRPITELLAPGALYMKNRGAGVPADKWVRVDTAGLNDGNLVTGGATDPLAAAELLRGAREVTYVGESDVAGVPTRHYKGRIDLGVAAKAATAGNQKALAAAAKGFGSSPVPFDVYLDDEGLIRKITHRFRFAEKPAGATKKRNVDVASTTLLFGFGKPAEVRLPDKRDVFAGKVAEQ